ncbi:MAG: hypothetical protein APF76_15855 [Desulfitibacter sp. BRH_c19]|nr:MAG: hypothetical protein APF76_15855 [Desulfitibacter sp. BRH_c19]
MARKKYGKTWWGNAWVEALERIDSDTNRLPRGRSYASGDRVSHIEITTKGNITAKVKGTRRRPYNVEIGLKKFNDQEIETIQELIENNPLLASELSMGKLPESLLELLDEQGVHLLPDSWNDIAAQCSCPDWANPCKHLAAVYYIVANEIDKDPYLLFKLRNVYKEDLLKNVSYNSQDNPLVEYNEELLFTKYSDYIPNGLNNGGVENIDLSSIANNMQGEQIFALLSDAPLFYEGKDFKKKLLKAYQNCAKAVEEIELIDNGYSFKNLRLTLLYPEKSESPYSFFISKVSSSKESLIFTGEEKNIFIPQFQAGTITLKRKKGIIVPIEEVIDLFLTLPLELPKEKTSPWADFLSATASVARALTKSSAFVPVVKSIDENGSFRIGYRPLDRANSLQKIIKYLVQLLPPDLIYKKKEKSILLEEEAIEEVIQLILSQIMYRYNNQKLDPGDEVAGVFFNGIHYQADSFEKRQTGKAIANWLAWLNLEPALVAPIIKIGLPVKGSEKFRLLVDVENKRDPLGPILPLKRVFSNKGETKDLIFSMPAPIVRREISKQLTIAGEYLPVLKSILQFKGKKGAEVTSEAMAEFLGQTHQILSLLGISVMIPRELKKMVAPRLTISAKTKEGTASSSMSYLNLEEMLDFSWQIALGDKLLSPKEFRELVKNAGKIVKYKNEYLLLKPEEIERMLRRIQKPEPKMSSMEILRAGISGETQQADFVPDVIFQKMINALNSKSIQEEISPPTGLRAELRPYQQRGLSWLYGNAIRGLGSCLADDMGLGKTVQIIALILKLKEEGRLSKPVLVVCPTTLIGNWSKELEKFAPSLEVEIYHGTTRKLSSKNIDIIITSYGILRGDRAKFKKRPFEMVVIDEAQNIKNPDTEQTRAVKDIKASTYIAMTGTPVENRLLELWSIFDFINYGFMGRRKDFQVHFANPIEKYRDGERIQKLKDVTGPFILRRLKSDKSVIKDLPDKVIKDEYCYLSEGQAALYQQVTESLLKEVEESEGIERRGIVFKLITSLKQICNHPVHYTKKGIVEKEHSGKALKTLELIQSLNVKNEKVLVFTQYKEMGELLLELLRDELKVEPFFFHGSLTRKKRDEMINQFQNNPESSPIMIVSLKAGGTGLNLTAASNVIHYDLWWNPAVEDQATDRTYRIGQLKNVMVHRLISIGTFEEKINEMIGDKRELAELTVTAGETRISEMSNKELKDLFMLDKH